VELINGSANAPYQVKLNDSKSDWQQIVDRIATKIPSLIGVLKSGDFSLQKESEFQKEKWIRITDDWVYTYSLK
jgi:uncharacterized Zn finger protein